MGHLHVSLHMTTSFHPQADGQAERHNRTIQEMLRAYVDPSTRSDWDEHLVSLEFAYNNSVHRATGRSPFFMLFGKNPNTPSTLLNPAPSHAPAVDEFLAHMTGTLQAAQAKLRLNQAGMRQQANKRRREVTYEDGDKVLVDSAVLHQAPTGKLSHKFIGPFTIAAKVQENAYSLDLPQEYHRTSSTFNVEHLKPFQDPQAGRPVL